LPCFSRAYRKSAEGGTATVTAQMLNFPPLPHTPRCSTSLLCPILPDAQLPSSAPYSQNPLHITLSSSLPNAMHCFHLTFTRRTSGLSMGKFGALKFLFPPLIISVVFSSHTLTFLLSFLCSPPSPQYCKC